MSAPAVITRDIAAAWRSQRGAAITLAVGVLALGLLFHEELVAAIHTWIASTAYNHCFLVIPIAAYLVWDRRETLHGFAAEPVPLVALAGIPLALAWLLAERLGIMEGRQLVAMSFVELLALAVLGWRLWWQLAGPLLYLYFLVPFGAFPDAEATGHHHGVRPAWPRPAADPRLHQRLHDRDPRRHVLYRRGLRRFALPDRLDRVRRACIRC